MSIASDALIFSVGVEQSSHVIFYYRFCGVSVRLHRLAIASPSHCRSCIAVVEQSFAKRMLHAGFVRAPHNECGIDRDHTDGNESNFGFMHMNATIYLGGDAMSGFNVLKFLSFRTIAKRFPPLLQNVAATIIKVSFPPQYDKNLFHWSKIKVYFPPKNKKISCKLFPLVPPIMIIFLDETETTPHNLLQ
jgi:hypothetical protein